MNAKYAVKVGGGDTYIAIGKVLRVYNTPYEFQVVIEYEDGTRGRYVLCTSFGTTSFGSMLDGGDRVVVRFAKEDQFARLVPMDELASRLSETAGVKG